MIDISHFSYFFRSILKFSTRMNWIHCFYVCLTGLCCVEAHKFKTISVKNRSKRGLNRGILAFIPVIMAHILHSIHCLLVQLIHCLLLIGSNGSWKIFRQKIYLFRQIIKFSTNGVIGTMHKFPEIRPIFFTTSGLMMPWRVHF